MPLDSRFRGNDGWISTYWKDAIHFTPASQVGSKEHDLIAGVSLQLFAPRGLFTMMNGKLIYDVGAHRGEDTEFYLKKGFAVIAIEANPELCLFLQDKFDGFVQSGQLRILNVAVSKTTNLVDFYIDERRSVWGSLDPDWVARLQGDHGLFGSKHGIGRLRGAGKPCKTGRIRKISVPGRRLIDIFNDYDVPLYCKIDVEGGDLDALKSLVGSSTVPLYISIESEKRDWHRLMEEFLIFRKLGYTRYKIVDQTLVEFQNCPRPPREGDYCSHAFQYGSSGLFGNELPGAWLEFTEAVESYRHIFRGYALNGDSGLFGSQFGLFGIFQMLGRLQGAGIRLTKSSKYMNPAHILPPVPWYDTHAAL